MLGQRVFRPMRVSFTVLWRQAQANSSSMPKPNSILPINAVLSNGRYKAKRLSLYAGFSHRETGFRQAAAARKTFLSECCDFVGALAWSEQHFAAASSASLQSRQGRAAGELVPLGPCFPGLHVRFLGSPCQVTQPQPCSIVLSLGWHPIHTTISPCRHRLAFYSGAQADWRTKPVLFPQERRGDKIPAHGPCT